MSLVVQTLGLRKEYLMRGGPVEALKGIDLEVKKGEYLSIMGPSGSGKTTLFNMIGGLDTPSSGNVLIEGKAISAMSPLERTVLRCHRVGYIFQTFNLIPALSALENVAMPMIFAGLSRNDRLQRARELLDVVGLSDRLDHKPTQLSGGQQQRVAIARAVANEPAIILADEPTGNLDLNTGVSIVQLLYRLKTESNTTVICATHDLKMIDVSDRIAWLTDGRIERVEEKRGITLSASELGNWSWE